MTLPRPGEPDPVEPPHWPWSLFVLYAVVFGALVLYIIGVI